MENFVALGIALLVLGLVGFPLLRERKDEEETVFEDAYEDSEMARLLAQKDTALTAIQELEFDHAVGSLSDEDYRELKERYEKKAISLLKSLDEIAEAGTAGPSRKGSRRTVKAAKARRGERSPSQEIACYACGEPVGVEDSFCSACGAAAGTYEEYDLACFECGRPFQEGDAFCAGCGAQLQMADDLQYAGEEEFVEATGNRQDDDVSVPVETDSALRRKRRNRNAGQRRRSGGNGKRA